MLQEKGSGQWIYFEVLRLLEGVLMRYDRISSVKQLKVPQKCLGGGISY